MNLIVAVDQNWGIGRDNDLLYHLPEDLKIFKERTTGKAIVCGRKTLESFPNAKPLPNRVNIVLTKSELPAAENLVVVHDLSELERELKKYPEEDVFLCGGESVYRQLYQKCKKAFVTKIFCGKIVPTVFFPDLDQDPDFVLTEEGDVLTSQNGLQYQFNLYENRR